MDIERKKKLLIEFLKEEVKRPLLFNELVYLFGVPRREKKAFKNVLDELVEDGSIFLNAKGMYTSQDPASAVGSEKGLYNGRFQGSGKGFGFVIPDKPSKIGDLFIGPTNINGAINNDRVKARIINGASRRSPGRNSEAEIVDIIERANSRILGLYQDMPGTDRGYVIPDDKKIGMIVEIPSQMNNNALHGQKVVVEIDTWPEINRTGLENHSKGRVSEVLGFSSEPGMDILTVVKSYNLEESFPNNVVKQAESISPVISSSDASGRHDLRGLVMVTIDDKEAKDLDDAVSLEITEKGIFRLGVHIADVSHYVSQDTPLDADAYKRGTSVYLADRVIPMLPQLLSNGICSLNPHEDRLAFTVIMDIDANGRVLRHEIFESIININERMTYKDVWGIVENNDKELLEKYCSLVPVFMKMKELAIILRSKRMGRGSIDFDFDEAKIELDSEGKPIDIRRYKVTIANRMIEEFMLICNETVAEHFCLAEVPFMYRVHEKPDPEKVNVFAEFVKNLGYHLKEPAKANPRSFQELINETKGKREEMIISTIMLRSLQKARYSDKNYGHFGLAADYYCHFTSPIRRYPDLLIHRIMKLKLSGNLNSPVENILKDKLSDMARHCSEREVASDNAERDVEDLKKTEYMKKFEGEVFEGVISNVTSFGIFVELENTIEGLVRISDLDDDYYVFDEGRFCLKGEHTKKVYRIGDRIKIKVARADVEARQIDFILEANEVDQSVKENYNGKSIKISRNGSNNGSNKNIETIKTIKKNKKGKSIKAYYQGNRKKSQNKSKRPDGR